MKIVSLLIVLCMASAQASEVHLRDIGVIGLASHDMFAWDRKTQLNTENGRLDLSTIFDYEDGKRWKKGGDKKNGENAPVWTITKGLVNFHRNLLKQGDSFEAARKKTVKEFHRQIHVSYKRLSGLEFPKAGINASVTNTEQAAMRGLHDILPGRVKIIRENFPLKSFALTSFSLRKFYLNNKELDQKISYFNGDYDQEYQEIRIPFIRKVINLKEVDKKFIEKFSPYSQAAMLDELKQVGEGTLAIYQVSFIHHIFELFQKGICHTDNEWMPKEVPCY